MVGWPEKWEETTVCQSASLPVTICHHHILLSSSQFFWGLNLLGKSVVLYCLNYSFWGNQPLQPRSVSEMQCSCIKGQGCRSTNTDGSTVNPILIVLWTIPKTIVNGWYNHLQMDPNGRFMALKCSIFLKSATLTVGSSNKLPKQCGFLHNIMLSTSSNHRYHNRPTQSPLCRPKVGPEVPPMAPAAADRLGRLRAETWRAAEAAGGRNSSSPTVEEILHHLGCLKVETLQRVSN